MVGKKDYKDIDYHDINSFIKFTKGGQEQITEINIIIDNIDHISKKKEFNNIIKDNTKTDNIPLLFLLHLYISRKRYLEYLNDITEFEDSCNNEIFGYMIYLDNIIKVLENAYDTVVCDMRIVYN